jgi:hypothetical protein
MITDRQEWRTERQFLPQFFSEVAAIVGFSESKDGPSKLSTYAAARINSSAEGEYK